jgi:hypothetical protein
MSGDAYFCLRVTIQYSTVRLGTIRYNKEGL